MIILLLGARHTRHLATYCYLPETDCMERQIVARHQ